MLIIKSTHNLLFFFTLVVYCNQSVLGMKRDFENKQEQEKIPQEQNTKKNDLIKEHGNSNLQPNTDIFKNNIWSGHIKK